MRRRGRGLYFVTIECELELSSAIADSMVTYTLIRIKRSEKRGAGERRGGRRIPQCGQIQGLYSWVDI